MEGRKLAELNWVLDEGFESKKLKSSQRAAHAGKILIWSFWIFFGRSFKDVVLSDEHFSRITVELYLFSSRSVPVLRLWDENKQAANNPKQCVDICCNYVYLYFLTWKIQTFVQHRWIFIFNTPSANDKKTTPWVKLYWTLRRETHQIPGLGWNSALKCLEDFWWTTPPVFVFCGRCDSLKSPKVFVEQQCLLGDKSWEFDSGDSRHLPNKVGRVGGGKRKTHGTFVWLWHMGMF